MFCYPHPCYDVSGLLFGASLKISLPKDNWLALASNICQCCLLLQEYVYKFNYDADGGVTVEVTTNGKAMDKGNKKKHQVFTGFDTFH